MTGIYSTDVSVPGEIAHSHILSVGQFNQESIETTFSVARQMERQESMRRIEPILAARTVAMLLQGHLSISGMAYQAATQALGGRCIVTGENPRAETSFSTESLHDTIKLLACYAEAIVFSHPEAGAIREATAAADSLRLAMHRPTSIINAGDGGGDPAQALTDLYTIRERFGADLEGLTIGFLGDLRSASAAHALIELLGTTQCRVNIVCIAPESLSMLPQYIEFARSREMQISETVNLQAAIGDLDVLYVTGTQRERFVARHLEDLSARIYGFPYQALDRARINALRTLADIDAEQEYRAARDKYVIDPMMLSQARKEMILMHPLPRGTEISEAVDTDDRAHYFRQVRNGLYIRMALLTGVLGEP